jgi:hypothetical protein
VEAFNGGVVADEAHVEQDQKPFVVVHQKVEDKVNAGLPVAIATFTNFWCW